MAEIKARREEDRLNDLREEVMEQLMDEGVDIDAMILDMVNESMSKLQDSQQVGHSLKISTNGLVFTHLECILHSTNTFIPIMICYALRDNDTIFHHWGTNCVQTLIKTILNWSKERKKEAGARDTTIFFHNLKGFDGIFMMDALYKLNLKVTDIMGTGTKMLHFKHKNLVFKDSLSFLNMPLTNFTNTFGLTELKKGWFPHKFSKLEKFHYEGTIPDLHYYEPQDTSKDTKKACEDWHAKQVLNGEVWNFKKELLSYCESDVKLLKDGCLKFAEDTMRDAGFNPLTKCITIASACHYFWRNHQMEPKTIAVEPPHGWGRLKTCQSEIAFQWLFYQDQQLGGQRIKHARNGGEQVIKVKNGKVTEDGYDPMTKTVYEFHGCEFHGCKQCKLNSRHGRRFIIQTVL